jgi:hypothetical protein
MSSRYDPIRETFTTNPLVNIAPLSTRATPPNDLKIPDTDFTSRLLFPSIKEPNVTTFLPRYKFDKRDIPRIVGMGIFGNMADCITPINEPCIHGLTVLLSWEAVTAAGGFYRTLSSRYLTRFESLNAIFDYDIFLLEEAQATDGGAFPNGRLDLSNPNIDATRLKLTVKVENAPATVDYSTILLDPRFSTKNFMLWGNVVVEHTLQMREDVLDECTVV